MVYMGSKFRFVKELLPIILNNRKPNQWYVEPFAGGMNVICQVTGNRLANDINHYLIDMWKELVNGWIPTKITKEQYTDIKNNKGQYPSYIVGSAGFTASYCGKWFAGFVNTVKTKRDYQTEAINNILNQIEKMKGVKFDSKPYYDLILPENSIVYCDPPYKGTTKYFIDFDHELFWNWVRNISQLGHTVFVSEYDAPHDFECVWKKQASSSLSAIGKTGGNKISIEKLFKPITQKSITLIDVF